MFVTPGWMLLVGLSHPVSAATAFTTPHLHLGPPDPGGRIVVWADRDAPYQRGEGARIYLRTSKSSYVTVLRVDTDGRIRMLFPREPWGRSYVRGDQTLEVTQPPTQGSFTVDDDPGVGYVFAIASTAPFNYDVVTRGGYWDFRAIDDGRIQGDPYVVLTDLAGRMAPRGEYDYDIAPYYVDHRYEYPRFVCYDCHSYASFEQWDPYATSCARFRVVIYDDPAYYPYRSTRGRNLVIDRPAHPAPRYVFKDARPGTAYVTRTRRSTRDEPRLDTGEGGRTSADVGGPGTIPAPRLGSEDRSAAEAAPEPHSLLRPGMREPGPVRSLTGERKAERRPGADGIPDGHRPAQGGPRRGAASPRVRPPRSTGEPELRRRKP